MEEVEEEEERGEEEEGGEEEEESGGEVEADYEVSEFSCTCVRLVENHGDNYRLEYLYFSIVLLCTYSIF